MAVEARRGCGYRKVGGLYLVGDGAGVACDRLPLPLTICPCCGHGFKQTRGWTWIDVNLLVAGVHRNCKDEFPCPLCMATSEMGKCGLLWIGKQFYPTPADFIKEAGELGISRRIGAVPRGFKVGETWVLLAHPIGAPCPECYGSGLVTSPDPGEFGMNLKCPKCAATGKVAGIFRVFKPRAIEKIITQSQSEDEAFMDELRGAGLTPVIVPDNDPDHQGTVYDHEEPEENGERAA